VGLESVRQSVSISPGTSNPIPARRDLRLVKNRGRGSFAKGVNQNFPPPYFSLGN